jgi:hypothetical protein
MVSLLEARGETSSPWGRTIFSDKMAKYILVIVVAVSGCNGGSGTTSNPPPPQQATAPTITPASGTYSSAQTGGATGAAGTTVHCTTDGTVPTVASAPCPTLTFNTNGTTTVKAYATESGYTDSAVVTNTIVINIPVPQSVVLPATMTTTMNSRIVVNSSILTASSSCSIGVVTFTLAPTNGQTATAGNAVLAKLTADPSGASYIFIDTGNAVTQSNVGSYYFTATCGSSTSTSTLTVTAAVPTISSVTPNVCAPSGCSMNATVTNGEAGNNPTGGCPTQFCGTVYTTSLGACPTTKPTLIASSTWVSPTVIVISSPGPNASLGSWNVSVINYATSIGTDGGWTCTASIYTITATGHALSGGAEIAVNPETGMATILQNGTVTATFNLGVGARTPVITADRMYVMQPSQKMIAVIDPASKQLSSLSLGAFVPTDLVSDPAGNVYALANDAENPGHTAIFGIGTGFPVKIAEADGLTAIAVSGTRLVGVEPSPDGTTTAHVFDLNAATEKTFTIGRRADSVKVFTGGILAYQAGNSEASMLDLDSLAESGTARFTAGILAVSGDRIALFDGNIFNVAFTADRSGKSQVATTLFSKQNVEDLYAGFVVSTANGVDMIHVSHRSTQGKLLLQQNEFTSQRW